jgi:monofunctional biosynthetic peptidoglycan transglycosylase
MISVSVDTGKDVDYDYVDFEHIADELKVCAMAAEDQNFPFHSGLDLEAIEKAIKINRKGRRTVGASTISQQVAKNAFLYADRSYIRKALELYFTFWVETLWTKEHILEMYLNIAEMGKNVFGAEAAAQSHFQKSASTLSVRESASIIAVLPSPRKYKVVQPGPYISGRQQTIARLYHSLDGKNYLRELYVRADEPIYDFRKYR